MSSSYHLLFAFTLLARICDLFSTWLVSPNLQLEANPLVRRFRWPFAFLTLFTALFAYWVPEIAVVIATASFLVAASNAMRLPQARMLGENDYVHAVAVFSAKGNFWSGWLARIAPAICYGLLAVFVYLLCPSTDNWGFWIAEGIGCYALVYLIYGTTAYRRFRKLGFALQSRD